MRPLRPFRATGQDPARDAADGGGHGSSGFLDTMPFAHDDESVPAASAPVRIEQALAHFEHAASALSATARMTRRPEDPARAKAAPGGPPRPAPKPAATAQDAYAPPPGPARIASAAAAPSARATAAAPDFAASPLEPALPGRRPAHAVSWTAAPTRALESDADDGPGSRRRAALAGSTGRASSTAAPWRRPALAIVAAAMVATACFVAWARQAVVSPGAPPPADRAGPGSATLGAAGTSRGVPAGGGELFLEPSAAGMPPATAQPVPVIYEAPASVASVTAAEPAPVPPAPEPAAPAPVRNAKTGAHRPADMPGQVSTAVAAAQAKADRFLRDGGAPAAPETVPGAEAR